MAKTKAGSEEALELATIELFQSLGYSHQNCFGEWDSGKSNLDRQTRQDVILPGKLTTALGKLNPDQSTEAIDLAIEAITKDRSSLSPAIANREIYKLLRDGVKVQTRDQDGNLDDQIIKIIDWQSPENNDFFLASQFWIAGETYTKRTDLLGFINGIPLVFMELKAHTEPVQKAYDDNFRDYRQTIPQLFWYNALVILSNGSQAKLGSFTSPWAYFHDWKRINDENEQGKIDLETLILGVCDPKRLTDIIENFILYDEKDGKLNKIIAKNHQYLGVNAAVARVQNIYGNSAQGKKQIGVFWHTQGSGKSYSMQFFAEKVCRKLSGNWKILVITDRDDLDNQIYKNFANTGAVTEPEKTVRANSATHLQELLSQDHRYVFTLIQKFRTAKDATYPVLSLDRNIIVIADEAHRSQYDVYSSNLRAALPNAAFIGFTGTPLISGEEEATRDVFGDYISIYNFRQSIEDGATVPLYYENRIPQLALTQEDLNDAIYQAIDDAVVDEAQEDKLAKEFSRQHQLLTRDARLEEIAKDIVSHFLNRGQQGKAMVVSIDRFTAVKMYDKVTKYWQEHLAQLKEQAKTAIAREQERLTAKIAYMEATDMAVVLSVDIEDVKAEIEAILDQAIIPKDYIIPETSELIDISQLNFDSFQEEFNKGHQNTLLEKLQQAISSKLQAMVKLNKSRLDYHDKFQQMIETYNNQTRNAEAFLHQLLELVQDLNHEDKRAIAENLDEEKLALFDLLVDPELELTDKDKATIKKGAEELLTILKREKLVLDWRKRQQTRASVKVAIEEVLDQNLPESYTPERFEKKCDQVYQHIYESYADAQNNIYRQAA